MCVFVLVIVDVYEMRTNTYCTLKQARTYPTVSEAERQCSDDLSCTMFFDLKGEGTKFYLCDDGAEIKRSRNSKAWGGSFLYIKSK